MEIEIPDQWRLQVAAILRSGDDEKIVTTETSDLAWQARFPEAWHYDRFEALAKALECKGVKGKIVAMAEPGDTYAFWFYFQSVKLYAKINLSPEGDLIVVYSSHTPRKGGDL